MYIEASLIKVITVRKTRSALRQARREITRKTKTFVGKFQTKGTTCKREQYIFDSVIVKDV